ncbi:MAG: transposase [Anaerolineae bacterium]|nr:transposase [Anaerolineae bacterium]
MRAFMPPHDQAHEQKASFSPDRVSTTTPRTTATICPQGHPLPFKYTVTSTQVHVYRARKRTCDACPVQAQCRTGKYVRSVSRSIFEDYVERAQAYQATEAYRKAQRKRQVWVEPLFGEAKQWHRLRRFRLRGLFKVNVEGLMTAAGQNIKRLLKAKRWPKRHDPAGAEALQPLLLGCFFVGRSDYAADVLQPDFFQQAAPFSLVLYWGVWTRRLRPAPTSTPSSRP